MNFYKKTELALGNTVRSQVTELIGSVVSHESTEIHGNLWRVRLVTEYHRVTISGHKFDDDRAWRVQITPPDISNKSGWRKLRMAAELLKVTSHFMMVFSNAYPELVA